ncbi:hypothetical protein Tco_0451247 [Tanacetum coccineum]
MMKKQYILPTRSKGSDFNYLCSKSGYGPRANSGYESPYEDSRGDTDNIAIVTKEVPKSSIDECRAIFANKGARFDGINKLQGVSFVANDEEDIPPEVLPCQLPPKELNLGNLLSLALLSIDTLDSTKSMQEPEVEHENVKKISNLGKITSRWNVCKHVRVFYDNECGKYCGMWPIRNPDSSFCSGYAVVYEKRGTWNARTMDVLFGS